MFQFKKTILTLSILSVFALAYGRDASIAAYKQAQAKTYEDEQGKVDAIMGAMESGKTEELIRLVGKEKRIRPTTIETFKPLLDARVLDSNEKDPSKFITSRNGSSISCIAVESVAKMKQIVLERNLSTIAIDEAQFFDKKEIMEFVHEMLALHKRIIISGLDLDFRGETFGAMGDLAALADTVTKLPAICAVCGKDTYCITQRIVDGKPAHYNDQIFEIGDQQYEPRCRNCHVVLRD
jgi:thymidine kinase